MKKFFKKLAGIIVGIIGLKLIGLEVFLVCTGFVLLIISLELLT